MGTLHCLNPHDNLPEVDYLGEGRPVLYCFACDTEFVAEDGELTPVVRSVMVTEAIADEDRRGWDGARERALSTDPYWGGVLDGPG